MILYSVPLKNGWTCIGYPPFEPYFNAEKEVDAWLLETWGTPNQIISHLSMNTFIIPTGRWTRWVPSPTGPLFKHHALGHWTIFQPEDLTMFVLRFEVIQMDADYSQF